MCLLAAQFFENFISFFVMVVLLVGRNLAKLFNGKINLLVFEVAQPEIPFGMFDIKVILIFNNVFECFYGILIRFVSI